MPRIDPAKLQKRILSAVVMASVSVYAIVQGGIFLLALVVLCAVFCLYEWIHLALKTRHRLLFMAAGVVYIVLCFYCCYLIRAQFSPHTAVLFVLMIWASDVAAYFAGKFIGGARMSREISPNKTWAGYIAAFAAPGLLGAGNAVLYTGIEIHALNLFLTFLAGALIGVVGQSGDLLISWYKRHAHVKDSSALIPGHGGMLDRVDALMLAAPVFLFMATTFPHVFNP